MYTITVWNRLSTNYGSSKFVTIHGTGRTITESKNDAMLTVEKAIGDHEIKRAELETPGGLLTWIRYSEVSKLPFACDDGDECDDDRDDYSDDDLGF